MKLKVFGLLFSICLLCAFGNANAGPLYGGVKIGNVMVDVGGYSDATNVGLLLGYTLSKSPGTEYGVEAEFTKSSSDGGVTVLSTSGKWNIDTSAIYAVGRLGSQYYLKGKIGLLHESVSAGVSNAAVSGSDTGLSLGVGAGWNISKNVQVEAEYTIVETDANYLSIGVNYRF